MSATFDFFVTAFGSKIIIGILIFFAILFVLFLIDATTEVKIAISVLYLVGAVSILVLPKWVLALFVILLAIIGAIFIKKMWIKNE